jgi:hypothetical protein
LKTQARHRFNPLRLTFSLRAFARNSLSRKGAGKEKPKPQRLEPGFSNTLSVESQLLLAEN